MNHAQANPLWCVCDVVRAKKILRFASVMLLLPILAGLWTLPAMNMGSEFAASAVLPVLTTDAAYVSQFFVQQTLDGTGGFDEDMEPSSPYYMGRTGNDASSSNKIVRSFDSISYDISYVTKVYAEDVFYEKGVIEFEFLLPLTAQEAQWNLSVMTWIDAGYAITTESRTFDFDGNRIIEAHEINVSCQVLRGQKTLVASGGNPSAIPGQGSLLAVVDVLGMKNASTVQPVFTAWMQHNQAGGQLLKNIPAAENTEPCDNSEHQAILALEATPPRTTEQVTVLSDLITVTAEPRYNIQVKPSSTDFIRDSYNFDEGNLLAMDMNEGLVEGRVAGYGITLQLYNNPDRNLKGIELPQGPLTFDLTLHSVFTPAVPTPVLTDAQQAYVKENYKPLVLSFDEHRSGGGQQDGRDLRQNGTAVGDAAPYNKGTGSSSCYNGGTWRAVKNNSTDVISVTVSDYVINPKHFPNINAGVGSYYDFQTGTGNIGCFSAGEIFIVMPFNNNGKSDPDKKGTYVIDDLESTFGITIGDGTFNTVLRDMKLRATSVTGQALAPVDDNSNQMRLDDDAKNKSIYLAKSGTVSWTSIWTEHIVSLSAGFSDVIGRAYNMPGEWTNYGLDTLARGSKLAVGIGFNNADNGDLENIAVAANLLGKFDADVLTLNGKTAAVGVNEFGLKYQMLYGTKPDGSNWATDDEMELARIENLKYYASLADIPSGHKCVAILAEIRPAGTAAAVTRNSGGNRIRILAEGTVNREESLLWNVYQTVVGGEVWRRNQYSESTGLQSMLGKTPVPYDLALKVSDLRPGVEQRPAVTDYRQYDKIIYHPDGTTTGHTGSYNYGDSLRIVDTTTSISKYIAQKTDGKEKTLYRLDAEQRYVDFVLEPRFDPLPEDLATTTTVTVIDTLPENVHYEEGSAYFDGTYVQHAEEGQPGMVTGGKPAEPEIGKVTVDGKERTTLKWVFVDADTRDALPKIHFGAMIGNMGNPALDVVNNQEFLNTATIETTNDRRPKFVSTGNMSQAGFSVSKLRASSLSKMADAPRYEVGDEMGFQVNVGNNSGTTLNNTLIVDTLPCDGEKKGSKFSGDILITGLLVDTASIANLPEWRCFYTTSGAAKDTSAKDYAFSEVLGNTSVINGEAVVWNEVTIGSDGTIPGLLNKKNIKAVVFAGNLFGGKVFRMHMDLQIPQADTESVVVNKISRIEDRDQAVEESAQAKSRIVNRQISGMAWNDANQDGQRKGENETALHGIKVQLLKKDEDTGEYREVKDIMGNPVFVETAGIEKTNVFKLTSVNNLGDTVGIDVAATASEDGSYLFSGLPAGTYGVRFEGGATPIHWYNPSPVNVGGDSYSDSDGVPAFDADGILQYTQIEDIVLPQEKDLLTSAFVSGFHDSGFYMKKTDLIIGKAVATGSKTKEFKFTLLLEDGNGQALEGIYAYIGAAAEGSTPPENGEFTLVDGEADFTLKHGQGIVVAGLPLDTKYTVTEAPSPGWTADQQTFHSVLGTAQRAQFVNRYTPTSATLQIQLKKTLQGNTLPQAKEFSFTLARTDNGDADTVVMPKSLTVTTPAIASGSSSLVGFENITFKVPGVYKFSVTETLSGIAGMTDAKPQEIVIEVTEENGVLKAEAVGSTGTKLEFVNIYVANRTSDANHQSEQPTPNSPKSEESEITSKPEESAKSYTLPRLAVISKVKETPMKKEAKETKHAIPPTGGLIQNFICLLVLMMVLSSGVIIIMLRTPEEKRIPFIQSSELDAPQK